MRVLSSSFRIAGFTMLVVSVPAAIVAGGLFRIEDYHFTTLLAPAFVIAIGAFALFRGRQLVARQINSSQFVHGQPTVLYLRSFGDDTTPRRTIVYAVLDSLSVTRVVAGLLEGWATLEEQLADALEPVGALVAIGRPGEPLPLPGARRIYAGEEWRQAVTHMMSTARLTVIRMANSAGVLWELERARSVLPPERLLILLPDHLGRKGYDAFREKGEQLLHVSLPTWTAISRSSKNTIYGRSGYIYFTHGGVSHFVPILAPRKYARGFKPYRQMLRYSFQPAYQALGVPWTPLKHVGGCLALIIIAIIMLFALVATVTAVSLITSRF